MSSILQSSGTMDTRSKPTFVLLGHHLFFLITYLFVSSCVSNVCLPPVCFIFLLCVIALYMVCVCVFVRESDHALCMMDSHGYVSDPLKP